MLKRGFQFAPGWRLEQFLGRGQFGQVWRASAPGGAAAAVKFIDLNGSEGRKEHAGIKRVKQIRHANLMPITAIWLLDEQGQALDEAPDESLQTIDLSGSLDDSSHRASVEPAHHAHWLVVAMLLGGNSLQDRLRTCKQQGLNGIPARELISYIEDAAKGLDFLNSPQHDLGDGPVAIQHCDVKPANIVLLGSSAMVCDFGLARILAQNQVSSTSTSGTPAYMAPEAIRGRPSRNTDQYSLAVTYYHLRTGRLPTADGSVWEVLDAHRRGELDLSGVPLPEREVLTRATSIEWADRYESNVDLAEALRDALRAEGETRPSGSLRMSEAGLTPNVPTAATIPSDLTPAANGLTEADSQRESQLTATTSTPAFDYAPPSARAPAAVPVNAIAQPLVGNTPPSSVKEGTALVSPASEGTHATETLVSPSMAALNPRTLKRVGIVIGVVVALVSLWIVFGRGTNDPEKKNSVVADANGDNAKSAGRPTRDASALLDEAFAVADSDLDRAAELFHAARQLSQEPIECLPQTIAGHRGPVQRILIDHDAQWLVTYADDPFLVARNLAGLGGTKPPLLRLQGPTKMVHSARFIGDTRRISSAGQDGVGRIWDLPTDAGGTLGEPTLMRVPHEAPVVGMAWSPKGTFAVLAFEDNHLAVYGAGSEGEVAKAFPVVATPRDVAFDPSGAWLICLNEDGSLHGYQEASLISETAPQPVVLTQGSDSVRTFAIAPGANNNPSLLAVGGEVGEVSLYVLGPSPRKENLVANAHALPAPQPIDSIAIVRAGKTHRILSGAADGGVHYWCPGNDPVTIHMPIHAQAISQVVCDEKGEWGAAASFDGTVSLIHLSKEDPKSLRFGPKSGEFHSVALDPHGRWLMAGDQDGNLWIWPLPLAKILTVTQDSPAKSI